MDWRWQLKNRITSTSALAAHIELTTSELEATRRVRFGWGISRYYLSLIDPQNPRCPIRLQAVPQLEEMAAGALEREDPLGEDPRMPVPGLIHRYPDRVLLLTTDRCNVYCRYCTRNRLVAGQERQLSATQIQSALDYVAEHREVREVILSGGDPLVSGDAFISSVLRGIRAIEHVDIIRVHTRMPVVNPFRITPELTAILAEAGPLFVVTHFNHPFELTPEASTAIARLVEAGIPVANQAVLLRGINSDKHIIEALCRELARNRMWNYYLHQCDLAQGTQHFRTPLRVGREIIKHLRGRIGGFAIPTWVLDVPGGLGKVPLEPSYQLEPGVFQGSIRGETATYAVEDADCSCSTTRAVRERYL